MAVDPKIIVEKLKKVLVYYNLYINDDIVKRIALLHLQFENIHPFVD
ncbi:Fic family protein [Patescibacteria group bacterium]